MELKKLTNDDVDAVIRDIYPAYFKEAIYNFLTPDLENAKITVQSWVQDLSFVMKDGDKVVGIVAANLGRTFYKEIECDVIMFYVLPEYRGTGVSRMMVEMVVFQAEQNKAAVIYSSCLSGIGEKNNNLYINLWKKYGFQILGTVMIRSNNNV